MAENSKMTVIHLRRNKQNTGWIKVGKKPKSFHNGEYMLGKLPSDVLMDIYQQESHMAAIAISGEEKNYEAWRYHRERMFTIKKVMGKRRRFNIRKKRHKTLKAEIKKREWQQRKIFDGE